MIGLSLSVFLWGRGDLNFEIWTSHDGGGVDAICIAKYTKFE